MDSEVVDLADVVPPGHFRIGMVRVRAAGFENDCAPAKAARLALHARQRLAVVDDDVVPGVLAERDKKKVTRFTECQHYGKRGSIADRLRMLHKFERA